MAKSKRKFYAVASGRNTGIFDSWSECEKQIKRFRGAVFKSFSTREQAQTFIVEHNGSASKEKTNTSTLATTHKDVSSPTSLPQKGYVNSNIDLKIPTKRQRTQLEKNISSQSNGVLGKVSIHLNFDGGSRGNPGIAGAGAYIVSKDLKFPNDKNMCNENIKIKCWKIRHFCGNKETNNVAEYTGLLVGLKELKTIIENFMVLSQKSPNTGVVIIAISVKGDSLLVHKQIEGTYKCKHEKLKPLHSQCINLIKEIREMGGTHMSVQLEHSHVYRNDNIEADKLANEAMDAKKSWITTDHTEIVDV